MHFILFLLPVVVMSVLFLIGIHVFFKHYLTKLTKANPHILDKYFPELAYMPTSNAAALQSKQYFDKLVQDQMYFAERWPAATARVILLHCRNSNLDVARWFVQRLANQKDWFVSSDEGFMEALIAEMLEYYRLVDSSLHNDFSKFCYNILSQSARYSMQHQQIIYANEDDLGVMFDYLLRRHNRLELETISKEQQELINQVDSLMRMFKQK